MTPTARLRRATPFLLLLTHVVLFFAFILAPIVIVVVISFSDQSYIAFPIEGVSLRWFRRVYQDRSFINAFMVSLEIAALSALCAALLGIPAALALARARGRLANAMMTLLLSPLSIPLIVLGFALLFFLSAIGFGVSFLSLLIAHSVVSLPYVVRTVAAVYRGVAPGLEEAAAVLGAPRWRVFVHITLPLIRPGVFAGCMFAVLISVDNLPISYFFGSASTNTLPVVMLSYLENQLDPTIAAVSTAQLVFAVALLLIMEAVSGRRGVGSLAL